MVQSLKVYLTQKLVFVLYSFVIFFLCGRRDSNFALVKQASSSPALVRSHTIVPKGRLELPCPFGAIGPKPIASANFATWAYGISDYTSFKKKAKAYCSYRKEHI